MNRKKIIATVSAIALAVIVTVGGGTLSLLTDQSEKITNTLNPKTLEIDLDEAKVDEDGKEITGTGAERVTSNTYNYVPGAVLDKDPTPTIPQNSASCYVYLWLTNELGDAAELDIDTTKWIEVYTDTEGTLYQYYQIVDEDTSSDTVLDPLFTTVTISKDLTADDLEKLGSADITVQAYAIQSENIDETEALSSAVSNFAGNGKTVIAVNTVTKAVYTADDGLTAAVSAAATGETIKLYADITTTSQINITKDLTIDLNGYDITQSNTSGGAFYVSASSADVTLEITGKGNSTITGYKYAVGTPKSTSNDLNLTVSNVTLITTSTASSSVWAIDFESGTSLTVENATIDATSSAAGYGIYSKAGTLTVTDTDISALNEGIYNTGNATVTGGTITNGLSNYGNASGIYNDSGTITISGTVVNSENTAVFNTNGTMTLEGGATITSTSTSSSDDGVKSSGTLYVYDATVTGPQGISVSGTSSTLDINGDDIKITGTSSSGSGAAVYMSGDTTLTVSGSPEIAGYNAGIYMYGATATINGGTISTTGTTMSSTGGPFGIRASYNSNKTQKMNYLTINGGTITGYNAGLRLAGTELTVTGGVITGTGNGGNYGTGISADSVSYSVTATISGGTITGSYRSLYLSGAKCTFNISEGNFVGNIAKSSTSSTLSITGGTYTADPTNYVDTTNYTVTYDDTAGTYTVAAN